jgi:hypothetical protein
MLLLAPLRYNKTKIELDFRLRGNDGTLRSDDEHRRDRGDIKR